MLEQATGAKKKQERRGRDTSLTERELRLLIMARRPKIPNTDGVCATARRRGSLIVCKGSVAGALAVLK
jgi:hypothetical protein